MYRNCQLIRVIQAFIEDKQYAVIGANPLVKLATEVIVNVGANIHIIPGYDPVTVQESAVKAVEAYFDALLLGVTAHESDVIVAMSVTGVDSVDSDTVQMALASDPFTYLQDIPIDKLSYLRTGPATVNITVS
jgi:phage-related baseplate assembly protein